MSVLTHTTTLPEAVVAVQQGRVTKDDLLTHLESNYVGLSKLYLLLQAGFTAEEFQLVSEVQDSLLKKQEADQKALLGRLDSDRPYASKKKAGCPVTLKEFKVGAKPLDVVVNGIPMTASVKEFSSGSFGWYMNGKLNVKVGDDVVSVQMGFNLTVIGSKPE